MKKFINIFKIPDLRKKLAFTASLLLVYRLGGKVPVPGINKSALKAFMDGATQQNSLLGLYDTFVGGFFSQASIFTLGIMPYISASIIIQLLGAVIPYFQKLQKEGELGRRKIIQLTRYGTVIIASMQAVGVSVYLSSLTDPNTNIPIVSESSIIFYLVTIITLVTGTVFIMWLGEQISDYGLGNGISLIIMCGILAQLPFVLQIEWDSGNIANTPYRYIALLLVMFLITLFVVGITTGTRKIPVQYAKRVVGRKVYGGQATHIPLKILTAGVMPIIFAQALMFIPNTLASFWPDSGFSDFMNNIFSPTHAVYSLFFAILIIIFTYFYTAISFNPVDVADNMKKQGGFIPGVRPGKATADYIDRILTRVTLPASIFLALIAVFPAILYAFFDEQVSYSLVSFYGGTSLIIIVGVALDTLQQIESHLLMKNYDGFLKSGRIRGRTRRY
ncbi:MAG: preprotein translocase subunit SecY [Candidatus Marinimicrobia bacterium]|nr:preprotein translocase subunit SecY [Candidatus Neomarinimicrobiota bacterium]|tara:strand:+ start:24645 stop:25985 length:1341 start_codon:yes stop_codon:yes gene_type:complete